MPTYEYRCAKGHAFDVFQKMSDQPVATCPECGGAAERVLSGGAGFLFKGEGFYITDYRSEDYRKKAQAEKTASGSPDAAPDKKPARSGKGEGGTGGTKTSDAGSGEKSAGAAPTGSEARSGGSAGSRRSSSSGGSGGSGGSSSSGTDG
jgi:putative FmdB family regulatory protein